MILCEPNNFTQWRNLSRNLLIKGITPDQVNWASHTQQTLVFGEPAVKTKKTNKHIYISKKFLQLAEAAACHKNPLRWSLLYSVAWRLTYQNPRLLTLETDPEVYQIKKMRQAVHRDVHKMKAFVRFKKIPVSTELENEYFVAWFQPSHHIIEYGIDFFVRRFANMNWSILSPDKCAHWLNKELSFTAGIESFNTDEDLTEKLWLEYYKNIFNPARLKEQAMQNEMPKKYWKNLPEAALIPDLIRQSAAQVQNMHLAKPTNSERVRKKSSRLKQMQDQLRKKS